MTRMKDLSSIKKELKRLATQLPNVEDLKAELNRLASEIRKFDFTTALPTAQRDRLEKRYRELKRTLAEIQKRIDSNFEKVTSFVRRSREATAASSAAGRKTRQTVRKSKRQSSARKKVAKKVRRSK
jgi:hypothetical protein